MPHDDGLTPADFARITEIYETLAPTYQRDVFALFAMHALIRKTQSPLELARQSYLIADAMLSERTASSEYKQARIRAMRDP